MLKNNKNLRKNNMRIVDPKCREYFLPINTGPLSFLRGKQIGFSGISLLKKRYEIKRPVYHDHLLLYTLEGSGWIRIGNKTIYTKANQVWICPKGNPHHYGIESQSWKIMWLSLKESLLWSPVEDFGNCIKKSVSGKKLEHSAKVILEELKANKANSDKAIDLNSRLIILYLEREFEIEADPHGKEISDKLQQLFERVNDKINHSWTVDELADLSQLYVCPVHFSRLCVKHMGQTPIQIVKKMRLERTKDLLMHTDYSLELISRLVGYQNPFSLSVAFKKYYNLSPRQYRKTHK